MLILTSDMIGYITDLPKTEPIILQLTGDTFARSYQLCIYSGAECEFITMVTNPSSLDHQVFMYILSSISQGLTAIGTLYCVSVCVLFL